MTGSHATRRLFITALAALVLVLGGPAAKAHHGWAWADDDTSEITGTVTAARLGNPHGEVTLDVDGEEWTVEVGQPWRNDRAGLTDDHFAQGAEMTIIGNRASDESELRMKARRVVIDGEEFVLYDTGEN